MNKHRFFARLFIFAQFFLSTVLLGEEIEIRLKTEVNLKPVYLAKTHVSATESNLTHYEDLRSVLEFDLNVGGFATVLPTRSGWEAALQVADVKKQFNLGQWRREKVPFVVCTTLLKKALHVTVFDVDKGISKSYEPIELTGFLDIDRKQMHKLADTFHKDFFGHEGIASHRLIYSVREKRKEAGFLSEIYVSDFDGANLTQVTFENDYCITPCFLPATAGRADPHFFFVSYKTGQSKIYSSSLKSKVSKEVLDLGGSQLLPSLNLKNSQMSFITDVAGRPDLFIQSIDMQGRAVGKPKQLFSAPRATQATSTFSPDGERLAFVSDKDGPPRIYVMDVKSKKRPLLLTKKNRENTSPSWSADSKKLAYSAKVDGVRQIWIYNFETGEEFPLTSGPQNKENPSWAPDSFHLVYNTDNEDAGELFLINLAQRIPTKISKGSGQKRFASWETK